MISFEETWKDIPEFDGYQASNLGDIRKLANSYPMPNGGIVKRKTKIMSFKYDKDGYKEYRLTREGKRVYRRGHRLVAMTFLQNPDNLPQINHLNGIRNDNRLDNLEWCTPSHNTKWAFIIGNKCQKGSNNNLSKLTENDVLEIRVLLKHYVFQKTIAEIYGVSVGAISAIKRKRTWKHLK